MVGDNNTAYNTFFLSSLNTLYTKSVFSEVYGVDTSFRISCIVMECNIEVINNIYKIGRVCG